MGTRALKKTIDQFQSYLSFPGFLIYINDLPYSVKNAKIFIYTADTSIVLQSESISQLTAALNGDLRNLHLWLKGNKLSLNVAKTQ